MAICFETNLVLIEIRMTPEVKAAHTDYLMAAMKGWFMFAADFQRLAAKIDH
jgi:hypothetical protein